MKKLVLWLLAAAVLAAGCGKDEIVPGSAPQENNNGNSSGNSGESGGIAPTPETGEEDQVDNQTFARTIGIVFSDNGGATVTGDENGIVTVSGNTVVADNRGHDETVLYKLSGTTANGSIKLYSDNRQALVLDGLSMTNPSGAAIDNQGEKRCYIVLKGTNALTDGTSATYSTTGDEDQKAVLFSEGQLLFSGSGSLTVKADNAQGKGGITSDDYIYITEEPVITVTAGTKAGHGIRGKDYVRIAGGTLNITTRAAMKKGIGSDGFVLVEGGSTTVNVSGGVAYDSEDQEYTGSAGVKADNYFGMTGGSLTIVNTGSGGKGIRAGSYEYDKENGGLDDSFISGGTLDITTSGSESNDVSAKAIKIGWVTKNGSGERATVTGYAGNLVISGGSIVARTSKSEAVEVKGELKMEGGSLYAYSTGDDAVNCQGNMVIDGGYVFAHSTQNDGLDANLNLKINGGYVFAITTKGSPEVALDAHEGYTLSIGNGATVVAYGGLESGYSAPQGVYSMSCSAGAWNALHNGSGFIAAFKAPSGISSVAVSAPSLSKGYTGVTVGESLCNGVWSTADISGGSSVNLGTYSGGGGPGGGPGGGGPGGGGRPW